MATEIFQESDAIVDERLRRAIHGEAIQIVRALDSRDAPSVIVLVQLGEGDVLYGMTLDSAQWLADQIIEAIAAMREG